MFENKLIKLKVYIVNPRSITSKKKKVVELITHQSEDIVIQKQLSKSN